MPLLDPFEPWIKLFETAGVALGVPLAVLLLGRSLIWAISGFSAAEAKQPAKDEDYGGNAEGIREPDLQHGSS